MKEDTKYTLGSIYFGILGAVVLIFGIAEIALGAGRNTIEWGPIIMTGDFLLWQGSILFFAGCIYLSGVKKFRGIHQQAKTVIASAMIWVLAGMYIFGTIMESIPGGEEGWFNTAEGFLAAYSAPYPPSLFILPFSLVVLYYLRIHQQQEDLPEDNSEQDVKGGE